MSTVSTLDKQNNTGKNAFIELLRFVLCIVIFLHHSGHVNMEGDPIMPSGGLAADAFFMLTGYYTIRHVCRILEKNDGRMEKSFLYSVRYTIKKLLKIFPYAAFGSVITYILECIVAIRLNLGLTSYDIISKLKDMIIEVLFLPLTGITTVDTATYRNAPMWYLSAMLFALPILMWVALKFHKAYRTVIVWLLPLGIQLLFMRLYGGVLPWMFFIGYINTGILRALSNMSLGGGIYLLSAYLSKHAHKTEKPSVGILLSLIEAVLYIIFLISMISGVHGFIELSMLYVFAAALTLSMSGLTYSSRLSADGSESLKPGAISIISKAAPYLGRLSMPIFCIHWALYRWVAAFYGYLSVPVAIVFTFALCVVTSIVLMWFIDLLKRFHPFSTIEAS